MVILPMLLYKTPAAIYLGEYRLYCWLFKMRRLLGLGYRLCLYTGGQAIPGNTVFDPDRDYLHHVTPVYLPECRHIPTHRQTVLPHFINDDFVYDPTKQQELLSQAAGKKTVLSVGLLDRQVKRMHLLIAALAKQPSAVFPVLLGEKTADTPALKAMLKEAFGEQGFIIDTLPHQALGDYYRVADLFVLCSPRESFGLAMAEALYHGVPVLCHDFAEARMIFDKRLHYVDAADETALTKAIHALLFTSQKPASVQEFNFSWEKLGQQYLELFGELMSGEFCVTSW